MKEGAQIKIMLAMTRCADRPSPGFVRIMRVHLAKRVAAQAVGF